MEERLLLPVEYFSGPNLACTSGPDHPETGVVESSFEPVLSGTPVWIGFEPVTGKPRESSRAVLPVCPEFVPRSWTGGSEVLHLCMATADPL